MARTWTPEDAAAAREERLQEFGERMQRAVDELVTGDDWIGAIAFAAKFRSRSFLNTMAIWVQHQDAYAKGLVPNPEPTYVAGFKQWQQLDRRAREWRCTQVCKFAAEVCAAAARSRA